MEYLKCNSCGHLNEIRTEYQTFCVSCKKKLENNFPDWIRMNPEKTFEDFKHLICISEKEMNKANTHTKVKKPKGLKYWIGFAVVFAIFSVIGQYGGKAISELFNFNSYDKVMMEVASELNKSCPIMVDSETRLDNTIALPDNVFQYFYTLVNMTKETTDFEFMKTQLEPTIINFVKTNPEMKFQRDHKTTVKYSYKDKNGIFLFTISVTPDMYLE